MMSKVASLFKAMVQKSTLKNLMLSSLLDICRVYLQSKLLKYLLCRFIPFMHSLQSNYFDRTLFYILGEMLNFVVYSINNLDNFLPHERSSASNIF